MKDKEKQIKSDCEKCVHDKVCYDCLMTDKCWGKDNDCEHYQPKLPEDSVVLSMEEYENIYEQAGQNVLANIADGGTSCHWCIEQHEKKASKETAEKIYRELCEHGTTYVKKWIKEQFGIEIKD